MAQYDVYEDPQPASRHSVPYVVDIQSGLIDESQLLSLMPHLAAPVPARALKEPVISIAHKVFEIRTALDAVVSGF